LRNLARAFAPLFFALAFVTVCAAQSPQLPPGVYGGTAPPRASPDEPEPKSWREFIPPGGGFSILFPGTPESTKHVARNGDPAQSTNTTRYTLEADATYSVTYADYVAPLDDPATRRALFDQFADRVASSLDAALLSQSDFTLDGHPGRLAAWRLPGGKILRGEAVIDGRRCYTIMVSVPAPSGMTPQAAHSYEENANKFLGSFKLIPALPTQQGEVDLYLAAHPGEVMGSPEDDIDRVPGETNAGRITAGKVISRPEPPYPPIARAARAQGPVVVRIVTGEDGRVLAAQVVSGHPLLQGAALQSARNIRFRPPLVDGKPVKFSGTVTFTFRLR
jgi:TonB family protein